MINQNKLFSFKIKCQAKNVFSSDVDSTVGLFDLIQNGVKQQNNVENAIKKKV